MSDDGPVFASERVARVTTLTVRITKTQDQVLTRAAKALKIHRADVARLALDYWLRHAPEAEAVRGTL